MKQGTTILDAARNLIELMPSGFARLESCHASLGGDGKTVTMRCHHSNGSRISVAYQMPQPVQANEFSPDNTEKLFIAILKNHVQEATQ